MTAETWAPPSPAAAELMRALAATVLEHPEDHILAMDAATLAHAPAAVAADPVLAASWHTSNVTTLSHWLHQTTLTPGARVRPVQTGESADLARDLVRRGLDATSLNVYRAGQNVAWQRWMHSCFDITDNPVLLRELLEISARSIFSYVDDVVAGIVELVEAEREVLTSGMQARRLEVVTLILQGAPVGADVAAARLGHDLNRRQTAMILWHESGGAAGLLERAADAVASTLDVARPLTVSATASSLWAWYAADVELDAGAIAAATASYDAVRLAIGATARGLDGFRRSHLDAVATQRIMLRAPTAPRVAAYPDVQLVSLLLADEEGVADFVSRTLGPLAAAEPSLLETLRIYLREQSSPSRAARALFTHRNTVLNRLSRAQSLLPAPLDGRSLQVAAALEVLHWADLPTGQLSRRPTNAASRG